MEAYINPNTNEVVIAVAGTQITDTGDLAADLAIATGQFGAQFAEAIDKSTALIAQVRENYKSPTPTFSVTGHSLGGAQVQVIAHTQGLNGSSYDSPGVSKILNDPEYQRYLASKGLTAKGVGNNFDNYPESGSPVSSVGGEHVGNVTIVNNRPNTGYIVSGLLSLFSLPLAAVALAVEAIAQHKLSNYHDIDPTKDPSLNPPPQPGEVQSYVPSHDSSSQPPTSDIPMGIAQPVNHNGHDTSLAQTIARVGDLGYGNYNRVKAYLSTLHANIAKGIVPLA